MAALEVLLRHARRARRLIAVWAAAATLGLAALAMAPAAPALAGATAHGAMARAAALVGRPMPARVVRCAIAVTLRYPHPLDATGAVKCSNQVARITLVVRIFRGTRRVGSRAFTRTQVRSLRGTTSVACVSGSYRARADGKVRRKNGNILTGHAVTRQVTVHC